MNAQTTKKDIGQKDTIPRSDGFVVAGEFVALWIPINPALQYHPSKIWTEDVLSERYLKPILRKMGWTDKDFQIPTPRTKCSYTGPSGGRCTIANTDGHHIRHMLTHLPNGIGYFVVCPACHNITRRVDNINRHRNSCIVRYHGEKPLPAVFIEAYKRNNFLRLPSTPELEAVAFLQGMQRTKGSLAFWLPGDQWEEPTQLPPIQQRDSVTAVMQVRRQLKEAQKQDIKKEEEEMPGDSGEEEMPSRSPSPQ